MRNGVVIILAWPEDFYSTFNQGIIVKGLIMTMHRLTVGNTHLCSLSGGKSSKKVLNYRN